MPNVLKKISELRGVGRVYVMGHSPADFDTLAAAWLAATALCRACVDAVPVLPDIMPSDDDIPAEVMLLHGVDMASWVRASQVADMGRTFCLSIATHSALQGKFAALLTIIPPMRYRVSPPNFTKTAMHHPARLRSTVWR